MSAPMLRGLAARIEAEHQAAYGAARTALEHAAECGRLLIEAKAQLRHGEWLPWLDANTTVGARQSQKYMKLARGWDRIDGKYESGSHLPIREAIALLAEPKPSPEPRAASTSTSDPWRPPPPPGQSLIATVITIMGFNFVLISPSTDEEHYYVTHILVSTKMDKQGLFPAYDSVNVMKKPVRWQFLPELVKVLAGIDLQDAKWSQQRFTGRTDRNPLEFDDDEADNVLREAMFPDAETIQRPAPPWPKNDRARAG